MPSVHGVLLRVEGCGVLLTGPSRIGKSELALALIDRGHQLVADDAPLLQDDGDTLRGRCSAVLQDLIELRGLGVINLRRTHGDAALADATAIELIIRLDPPDTDSDRMQGNRSTTALKGHRIPTVGLPIAAGSSLALLVETAVRDLRLRQAGSQADHDLLARQARQMEAQPCN